MTDYGTESRISETIALIKQGLAGGGQNRPADPLLIVCKKSGLSRTTARYGNGLSADEIKRISSGCTFMAKTRLSLFWAVLGDELLDMESGEARKQFERFTTQLVIAQRREGLPQYWLRVLEASGGLHSNIVFVGNEKIARSLQRSFAPFMHGEAAMQEVNDIHGLASRYLSKERTTQANWALGWKHSTRRPGSHRIEGGGDRVTLSSALKQAAIAANYVEPWQATNAKRAAYRSTARPVLSIVVSPQTAPETALTLTGQLCLFPEMEKPVTRLRAFTGGILSPSAALELEYHRRRRGLSQQQLGRLAGLSQPTLANAVRGRFGLSRQAANRIREVLAA